MLPPSVSVQLTPGGTGAPATNVVAAGNEIKVSGSTGTQDCGAATLTNTATIGVLDASPDGVAKLGPFYIPVDETPVFSPGFGNEPGDSDELEFGIGLGPGRDVLGFHGLFAQGAITIRLGASGDDRYINLNARETTGIDQDVLMTGVDQVTFTGSHVVEGDDDVRGSGGKGTGSAPTPIGLSLEGLRGDDFLMGGSAHDQLHGGPGNDTLAGLKSQDISRAGPGADIFRGGGGKDYGSGNAGPDRLFGGRHADFLAGNAGNDRLVGGSGDDELKGGKGRDVCVGGKGVDTFVGCEVEIG